MASGDVVIFRQAIKERLLVEMLRGVGSGSKGVDWKVLVMDEYTVKVMSSTCKMADITDEGISLVEDLKRKRQPVPLLDVVYFIQPTKKNIAILLEDMGGTKPMYRSAYIFFSSPVSKELLEPIKANALIRTRIAALREMNLEISTVDRQAFVTDQENALLDLFGPDTDHYERCIDTMAARLATVFASLKEFPAVRYRAERTDSSQAGTLQRARDLVPKKLAAALWDRLIKYKEKLPGFPHQDSCDLLILDRTTDPVAPLIHDWSYGGMAFDLLDTEGNKYTLKYMGESGKIEEKVALLEEQDPVWVDLRDLFIAEALEKVTKLSDDIASKRTPKKGEMSAQEMQALIASLGKYTEQKDKVDLHVNIAGSLMKKVRSESLTGVGRLEQGFVFGDSGATFKELFSHLESEDITEETKVRLLAVYAATHPDKFVESKRAVYMRTAGLEEEDLLPVVNFIDKLGLSSENHSTSKSSLTFGRKSSKGNYRQDRGRGDDHELLKFYPLLHDLVEDIHKGQLDSKAYPFVQEPRSSGSNSSLSSSASERSVGSARSQRTSVRSQGSSGGSWASRRSTPSLGGEGGSSASAGKELVVKGRRILVFVVGGLTRSELRAAHLLTQELQREVIVGSSSLETPRQFLKILRGL